MNAAREKLLVKVPAPAVMACHVPNLRSSISVVWRLRSSEKAARATLLHAHPATNTSPLLVVCIPVRRPLGLRITMPNARVSSIERRAAAQRCQAPQTRAPDSTTQPVAKQPEPINCARPPRPNAETRRGLIDSCEPQLWAHGGPRQPPPPRPVLCLPRALTHRLPWACLRRRCRGPLEHDASRT